MSVQFGKCNFDGKPVDPCDFDKIRPLLAPYGPDGEGCVCRENFGVLYRSFHTTEESRREVQPHVSRSGFVLTWDGRLDNREELIGQFAGEISTEPNDLEIVAATYQRWGTDAFGKLIGDWALSVWNPNDQSLILAKDFIGTRHLYYTVETNGVTWCTILDPLVLSVGHSFKLEEEYIAGWLAFFPMPHLTPYVGVDSVPPSSFVRLSKDGQQIRQYWDFDPGKRIRYRTDKEYEEHFRAVFAQSVRRRLRSDRPVLAELSGGMDSSSIVCMADSVIAAGRADTPRLDTLSYFDDSEPNWNERPLFSKVENNRGRTGCHIDCGSHEPLTFELTPHRPSAVPGSGLKPTRTMQQVIDCMQSQGNRVVLSGVGGDEVTGGVPTPVPELADLLREFRLLSLARQLKTWALHKRTPWTYLLGETVREFLPRQVVGTPRSRHPAPWLNADFVARNLIALGGYQSRMKFFASRPSFQENLNTLDTLRRQMECSALSSEPPHEKRYPYLDRDFLEFLYSVPRNQLVRPGQRRSLMRRALDGIVPEEILNRRRKAFVIRSPLRKVSAQGIEGELKQEMTMAKMEIVNLPVFYAACERAAADETIPLVALLRTLGLEMWLRNVVSWANVVGGPSSAGADVGWTDPLPLAVLRSEALSAESISKQKGGETHGVQEAANRSLG